MTNCPRGALRPCRGGLAVAGYVPAGGHGDVKSGRLKRGAEDATLSRVEITQEEGLHVRRGAREAA